MSYYTNVSWQINGRTPQEFVDNVMAAFAANPEVCTFSAGEDAHYAVVSVAPTHVVYSRICDNGSSANFQINLTYSGAAFPGRIGAFTACAGIATITNSGGSLLNATQGMEIVAGETIDTSSSGEATLAFDDGTTLGLRPNTRIIVDAYAYTPSVPSTNNLSVRVIIGFLRAVTGAISTLRDGGFQLLSPSTAVASGGGIR